MTGETSALKTDMKAAYGLDCHAKFQKAKNSDGEEVGHDCLVDYEPLKLSSFRVFCLSRGTIVSNPLLLTEQLLLTLVFFGCAIPVYVYFKSEASQDISIARFLSKQESKMRAFAMIMTGLACFLLSFYTSIAVSRWWTMRANGIGAIKASVIDLQALIYHQVSTKDDPLTKELDAVQRYGRASLMLIFLWRQNDLKNMRSRMEEHDILNEEECDILEASKHCLHETIWAWQLGIVTKLHKKGKIKSDQLFALLCSKCTDGRAAAQCIHTHLAVRVPMQYVHLLGFLVKMHNVILAVIMGLLFGAAWRNGYAILMVQLFGRTLILPFLFNAILLINCDLSDPFNGGEADFPGEIYVENLKKDSNGILDVSKNLPDWLA
jgi:hypothetical protein